MRTMSAQHLPRETYILREMLCGHCSVLNLWSIKKYCYYAKMGGKEGGSEEEVGYRDTVEKNSNNL